MIKNLSFENDKNVFFVVKNFEIKSISIIQ